MEASVKGSNRQHVQHKWFATFGHCLFRIEWLLEEPFWVREVFSMDWWQPLKLDIWFRTFRDVRSGKFLFWILNTFRRNFLHHRLLCGWMNPLRHHLYRRHRHCHHLPQGIWKYFFCKVLVMLNVCVYFRDNETTMITLGLLAEILWAYLR